MLCSTTDGFKVAEYDLKSRGPGEFFGQRQHGLPGMKIADLSSDIEVLEDTQHMCAGKSSPGSAAFPAEHRSLAELAKKMIHSVGERPN
jgi:ATP-dependent DNA helicase RecG